MTVNDLPTLKNECIIIVYVHRHFILHERQVARLLTNLKSDQRKQYQYIHAPNNDQWLSLSDFNFPECRLAQ